MNKLKKIWLRLRHVFYYEIIKMLFPDSKLYTDNVAVVLEKRAASLGYNDLIPYLVFLRTNEEEKKYILTGYTYKGTHFFRGNDWEFFDRVCLSGLQDKEKVRIWCAGCSSGEEIYSLVMAVLDHTELKNLEVLATDYDDGLLEKCRKGIYSRHKFGEIPENYQKYLNSVGNKYEVRQELRDIVKTENLNLLKDPYPDGFDIISCRNVIKFFSRDLIPDIQKKLAESLAAGGFLFLSNDDGKCTEMIKDPEKFGLIRLEDHPIYKKTSS